MKKPIKLTLKPWRNGPDYEAVKLVNAVSIDTGLRAPRLTAIRVGNILTEADVEQVLRFVEVTVTK